MIHLAVSQVVADLNQYLNLRAPTLTPDRIVADSLFDLDGAAKETSKEKVVVSLVNVEQDRVYRKVDSYERADDGASLLIRPEVNLNLYLLFIANLSDYNEALKAISLVISFFQRRSVFVTDEPEWGPAGGSRVSFELFTLTFEQQNYLWGAIGSKFMPCVMYKAGLVKLRDEHVEAEVAAVTEIRIGG